VHVRRTTASERARKYVVEPADPLVGDGNFRWVSDDRAVDSTSPTDVSDVEARLASTRQARASVRTRETIVEATIRLLDEHGEQGLRVADVTRMSGISVGSIYHHFGGRDGLIKAARARQFRASHPTYGDIVIDLANNSKSAREFVQGMRDLNAFVHARERSDDRLQRVAFIGSSMSRPDLLKELQEQQTELISAGAELAQLLRDRGWLRADVSPRAVVILTLALELGGVVADMDAESSDNSAWVHVVQLATESLFVLDDEDGD
jgi:AcrR family transcriptional regulator